MSIQEPFLYKDFICEISKKTVELGLFFDRIMTNGVWFRWNLGEVEAGNYYMRMICSNGHMVRTERKIAHSYQLNDTNILEQVLSSSRYASIRQVLVATEINDVVSWLVNEMMSKKYNRRKS